MTKREKTIGIIVLVIVAIWGISFLSGRKVGPLKTSPAGKPFAQGILGSGADTLKAPEIENIAYKIRLKSQQPDISSMKDPFKKMEPKASGLEFSDLVLSGVMWSKETPVALVNDQFLEKGDTISGFKVEEIKKDEVVLIKGVDRYTLKLFTGTHTNK